MIVSQDAPPPPAPERREHIHSIVLGHNATRRNELVDLQGTSPFIAIVASCTYIFRMSMFPQGLPLIKAKTCDH